MKFKTDDQIDPRATWVLREIDRSLEYEVIGPSEIYPTTCLNVRLPDGVRPFHTDYMQDPPLHLLSTEPAGKIESVWSLSLVE
jgi:hypothetical protein